MARGGVSAGFLLRAARGAWWSRPGGFWGSGEAAAPATARRFRATGTWDALGDSVGPSDPSGRRAAAHPTVFSRLAAGGGGRSWRPRAAWGRVSAGAKPPILYPTRFLWSPPCPVSPFDTVLFPWPSKPPKPRCDLATAPIIRFGICTLLCPQGERGVRRPVRPADSGERQSGGQCSPPGPAPWNRPGRWEPCTGNWGHPYSLFKRPRKSDMILCHLTLPMASHKTWLKSRLLSNISNSDRL